MDQQNSENPLKEGVNAQAQQQQTAEGTKQKAKKKSKKLLLIIILLVVLVWGGVAVVVMLLNKDSNTDTNVATNGQEKEDEETDEEDSYEGWKIYTSKNGTYSLKYPNTWGISSEDGELESVKFSDLQDLTYEFQVVRQDLIDSTDPFSTCMPDCVDCDWNRAVEIDSLEIDDESSYEAYKYYYSIPATGDDMVAYRYCATFSEPVDLRVEFFIPKEEESDLTLLQKVIASIVVSSSSQSTDPYEGWETYTDEERGFSFKYPGEWTYTSQESFDNPQVAYGEAYFETIFEDQNNGWPLVVYLSSYYGDPDFWCELKAGVNMETYEVKSFAELEDKAGNPSVCYLSGKESNYIVFMTIDVDSIVIFEGGVDDKEDYIKIVESFEDID